MKVRQLKYWERHLSDLLIGQFLQFSVVRGCVQHCWGMLLGDVDFSLPQAGSTASHRGTREGTRGGLLAGTGLEMLISPRSSGLRSNRI